MFQRSLLVEGVRLFGRDMLGSAYRTEVGSLRSVALGFHSTPYLDKAAI